jgi:GTP-binding protein HflX
VQQLLTGTLTTFDLTLPYDAGQLKNTLYELGVIQAESYDETGHECLTIRLPSDRLKQILGQANLSPLDVLPLAQASLLMPTLEPFEQAISAEQAAGDGDNGFKNTDSQETHEPIDIDDAPATDSSS